VNFAIHTEKIVTIPNYEVLGSHNRTKYHVYVLRAWNRKH